ncbi:hypothetical protein, partial [Alistipes finegoldii]|uniref:hypothetical protein n=2 Tax=Alistipes finegoldii TaxID=214856 RepID=UPI0024302D6B
MSACLIKVRQKIGNKKECRPEKPHPYIIRPEMLIAGHAAGAFSPVCGECRICWAPELILENDKYFLYLRLKENLFTKHFGVVFWVSRQIFNMFVLLRSVKI